MAVHLGYYGIYYQIGYHIELSYKSKLNIFPW